MHNQPNAPIVINSDDDFTSDNGVTGGSGTSDDPYMITGWNISNPAPGNGITIRNTDAYFVISGISIIWASANCLQDPQCWRFPPNGILLQGVEHGAIINSKVHLAPGHYALNITLSDDIRISNNHFTIDGLQVVFLKMSSNLEINNNLFGGGAFIGGGSYLSDASITGNTGGAEDGIGFDHVNNILFSNNTFGGHSTFGFSDCSNVTIDNNRAYGHDGGIGVSSCGSFEIHGNTVTGTAFTPVNAPGIDVVGSSNFDISDNNVTNFKVGLSLVSASEFSVDSFQCSSCGTGILVHDSSAGLIQNSDVTAGGYGLRMDFSNNILVQDNRLRAKDGWGFSLKDSTTMIVQNNELSGGSGNMMEGWRLIEVTIQDNYGTAEEGANLINVRNVSILSNRFNASHDGLIVRGCSDVTIAGNQAGGTNRPIGLEDCTNVSISQNTASFSRSGEIYDAGISLIRSTGISISDNQVTQNQIGILLRLGATGNAANDNVISNNACGIQTDQSTVDQNDLSNNTFQANTQDYCSA